MRTNSKIGFYFFVKSLGCTRHFEIMPRFESRGIGVYSIETGKASVGFSAFYKRVEEDKIKLDILNTSWSEYGLIPLLNYLEL